MSPPITDLLARSSSLLPALRLPPPTAARIRLLSPPPPSTCSHFRRGLPPPPRSPSPPMSMSASVHVLSASPASPSAHAHTHLRSRPPRHPPTMSVHAPPYHVYIRVSQLRPQHRANSIASRRRHRVPQLPLSPSICRVPLCVCHHSFKVVRLRSRVVSSRCWFTASIVSSWRESRN